MSARNGSRRKTARYPRCESLLHQAEAKQPRATRRGKFHAPSWPIGKNIDVNYCTPCAERGEGLGVFKVEKVLPV